MTKSYIVTSWREDQRQVVASVLIPQGTIIMKEEPLVWVKRKNESNLTFPWILTDMLLSDRSKLDILMSWKLLRTTPPIWDNDDEKAAERLAKAFRIKKHEVKSLYELICTNNLICYGEKYENIIGYGIFHYLSFVNHDCIPNSAISDGDSSRGEMMLTSMREIKRGESITYTYLSDLETSVLCG